MAATNTGVSCHSGGMTTANFYIRTKLYNFNQATVTWTAATGRNICVR
jgi:predicted CxxxxCH...CXXCH cytochrome family protein